MTTKWWNKWNVTCRYTCVTDSSNNIVNKVSFFKPVRMHVAMLRDKCGFSTVVEAIQLVEGKLRQAYNLIQQYLYNWTGNAASFHSHWIVFHLHFTHNNFLCMEIGKNIGHKFSWTCSAVISHIWTPSISHCCLFSPNLWTIVFIIMFQFTQIYSHLRAFSSI